MCLTDALFDLSLVVKKGFQRLIEVFLDEILHQLIVHANDANKERHWEGIQLWRVEFQYDLRQDLSRNIPGCFRISNPNVVPLLDERADLLKRQVPAMGGVIISPIGVLFDFENLFVAGFRHTEVSISQLHNASREFRTLRFVPGQPQRTASPLTHYPLNYLPEKKAEH